MKLFRTDEQNSTLLMRLVAGAMFLAGLFEFGLIQVELMHGHPFDPIAAGDASIMIVIGMCASVLGSCLRKIERRLSTLESELSRPRSA